MHGGGRQGALGVEREDEPGRSKGPGSGGVLISLPDTNLNKSSLSVIENLLSHWGQSEKTRFHLVSSLQSLQVKVLGSRLRDCSLGSL